MGDQDNGTHVESARPSRQTRDGEVDGRSLWNRELLEQLAAVEHARWAHWQRYLHSKCQPTGDGSLVIPADLVARWTAQMATPYEALSGREQDSDREQVLTTLNVIAKHLQDDAPDSSSH